MEICENIMNETKNLKEVMIIKDAAITRCKKKIESLEFTNNNLKALK